MKNLSTILREAERDDKMFKKFVRESKQFFKDFDAKQKKLKQKKLKQKN